ncbi:MAG: aspartate/glutamate racemase family protein, partial [Acidaminococcaceae bacterium]|nr:aspartate/glutamate racemase family protein [Acidaminococcaceae bacterium]
NGSGMDMWQRRDEVLNLLQTTAQAMVEQQQVQVIILGCLSFLGLARPLAQLLGVPVIDPAIAAVSLAESLVRQGLYTSKKAYPLPLDKVRTWEGGSIE